MSRAGACLAQGKGGGGNGAVPQEQPAAPERVEMEPLAADSRIERRLRSIFEATDWFTDVSVRVHGGVVFIDGRAISGEKVTWAGDLARRTQGVGAVVNRMTVDTASAWDLSPAWHAIVSIARQALLGAPLFVAALVMLALGW
jgi:hypothetical protein